MGHYTGDKFLSITSRRNNGPYFSLLKFHHKAADVMIKPLRTKEEILKSYLKIDDIPTQIKNPELVRKRRQQIVDATVQLLVKYDYHKTTTRMIAKSAGLSIGSLYEYVESKEDVLCLVCDSIHLEVEKAVKDTLLTSESTKKTLKKIIRNYFLVCHKMTDPILLLYQNAQFLPGKWKAKIFDNELRISNIFIQILQKISIKDNIPNLDKKTAFLVGHNIVVMGQMWVFRKWYFSKHFSIDEYIKYQTEFILGITFQHDQK